MANELKTMNQSELQKKSRRHNKDNVKQNKYWYRIRLIPIWLRIVLVLLLWFLATISGLMIGYSVLGDGKALDALKWDTWQHILNIMDGSK